MQMQMQMKKLLVAVLVLALVLSATALVACGNTATEDTPKDLTEETVPELDRPAWAADLVKGDGKTVTVGADTAYPPFEFAAEDGSGGFQGFDVDLLNAIGEKLNLTFEFKTFAFDGLIAGLATGTEFDMITSALTIKPERAKSVDFGLPYYMDSLALVVPNDSKIASIDDIKAGTRVAVQNGSSAQTWADKNLPKGVKYVLNEDTGVLFQSLQSGDADCLIQDMSSSIEFVKDPVRNAKIAQNIESSQFFGMAFQQNEKGAAMRADIDAALVSVVVDGTYAKIYQKWFGVEPAFLPGEVTLEEALAAFGS